MGRFLTSVIVLKRFPELAITSLAPYCLLHLTDQNGSLTRMLSALLHDSADWTTGVKCVAPQQSSKWPNTIHVRRTLGMPTWPSLIMPLWSAPVARRIV